MKSMQNKPQYISKYESPLGGMTLASDGECLIGLWFDDQSHFGSTLTGDFEEGDLPVFKDTRKWLDVYFSGRDPGSIPRIKLIGTDFRKDVWSMLLDIPYGELVTYGDIADKVAKKRGAARMSAQAVGNAVSHNPILLIVPCHRVIGKDGSMTGYAGGIERKEKLIMLEKATSWR